MERTLEKVVIKYEHIDKWKEAIEEEQERIKTDNQKQDLVLIEVKTKLSNIEALLIEIKQDM